LETLANLILDHWLLPAEQDSPFNNLSLCVALLDQQATGKISTSATAVKQGGYQLSQWQQ